MYAEIQQADTVGVFQIESRAQMQSLLQTRPENLDDLTVQVALVRPGPIQGKAVHPYIKHRQRLREDPSFEPPVEHESLREALRDTLGVVVFQDQVLDVAMAAAGFSIGEAEGLRRAMSRKRSEEAIEAYRPRFVAGCLDNGIDEATAHVIYDKLVGFAGFGFPKSHAAAFGLLAYQSAWLRRYYPAEFLCALMNAQPMGFYPPSSLVRDAQRRGVEVRPPHVNRSRGAMLDRGGRCARRARLRAVGRRGRRAKRSRQGSRTQSSAISRGVSSVKKDALESLVAAGACDDWGERRALLWRLGVTARGETVGGGNRQLALPLEPTAETPDLPAQTAWEQMLADYKHTSLSVGVHPLQLLRPHLPAGVTTSADLPETPNGTLIEVAGMAVARQRPATANGVVFMLLEDEYGQANLIVPPPVYERYRAIVRGEPLLLARGKLERHGRNVNLLVASLESLGPLAREAASEAEVVASLPRRTTSATAEGVRTWVVSGTAASDMGSALPQWLPPDWSRCEMSSRNTPNAACQEGGWRCSLGLACAERLYAELTRPTCVNACGKLPSSRFATGSYSSEIRPRSLRSASSRSNSCARLVVAALHQRARRRARTSTAGTRLRRPAGRRRRSSA